MLTSVNRLIGRKVLWRDQELGHVERAVADAESRRLHGLVIRRGMGSARWVPADSIRLEGRSCVLKEQPVRLPKQEPMEVRYAVLASGQRAGEVCDVILHADTLRIAALEVTQGPLYRLMGRCGYASGFRRGEADEVMIGPLLTWTQLLRQLGEEAEA
ncbi:MAG: hypothetical protein IKK75_15070 [Clostridia bacterium]|nr:hypothetical protein [Clostridia bacterium]